jgi:hypothetical protein
VNGGSGTDFVSGRHGSDQCTQGETYDSCEVIY